MDTTKTETKKFISSLSKKNLSDLEIDFLIEKIEKDFKEKIESINLSFEMDIKNNFSISVTTKNEVKPFAFFNSKTVQIKNDIEFKISFFQFETEKIVSIKRRCIMPFADLKGYLNTQL